MDALPEEIFFHLVKGAAVRNGKPAEVAGRLGRQVGAAKRRGCTPGQHFVMDGSAAALVGYLIPACLSAPTISAVSFFALLALLVAACAAAEIGVVQPGWVWYEPDETPADADDGSDPAASRNEATLIND